MGCDSLPISNSEGQGSSYKYNKPFPDRYGDLEPKQPRAPLPRAAALFRYGKRETCRRVSAWRSLMTGVRRCLTEPPELTGGGLLAALEYLQTQRGTVSPFLQRRFMYGGAAYFET